MNIIECLNIIESGIHDPQVGLPEEVFLFASRITPMVNVDLLIQDENKGTLLTWRQDTFEPPGWHIPGGIIRFKESFASRIHAVAKNELGAQVQFSSNPLTIKAVLHPTRKTRGHFISMLFRCTLLSPPNPDWKFIGDVPKPNQWKWHETCPNNLIPVHEMYRSFV
jgi:colanic acid biosynthesis protein WcaH